MSLHTVHDRHAWLEIACLGMLASGFVDGSKESGFIWRYGWSMGTMDALRCLARAGSRAMSHSFERLT
ncbi:hypothetical protein VTK26DRAFT_4374 [Humicola hyalothermophila]